MGGFSSSQIASNPSFYGSSHKLGYDESCANTEHGWFTLHCAFTPWHVCASNHNTNGHVSYHLVHHVPAGAHPHPASSSNVILRNGLIAQRSALSSGTWRAALWVCSHQLLGRHSHRYQHVCHLVFLALLTQFNINYYRSYLIFLRWKKTRRMFSGCARDYLSL